MEPQTLGAGAQIALKLIEQLPSILTALGTLTAVGVGLWNARKINKVQTQTDGHFSTLTAKNDALQEMTSRLTAALAVSVPVGAVAAAVTADRANDRAVDRATDRATDRAADRAAALSDRRADAVPLKVAIVEVPEDFKPTDPTKAP